MEDTKQEHTILFHILQGWIDKNLILWFIIAYQKQ
jgi:hypothetical protein